MEPKQLNLKKERNGADSIDVWDIFSLCKI